MFFSTMKDLYRGMALKLLDMICKQFSSFSDKFSKIGIDE